MEGRFNSAFPFNFFFFPTPYIKTKVQLKVKGHGKIHPRRCEKVFFLIMVHMLFPANSTRL